MKADTHCKICGQFIKANELRIVNRSGAAIHLDIRDCWLFQDERPPATQPAPHRVFPLENWLYW